MRRLRLHLPLPPVLTERRRQQPFGVHVVVRHHRQLPPSSSTRTTSILWVEIWATGIRGRPPAGRPGRRNRLGTVCTARPSGRRVSCRESGPEGTFRCHPSSDPPTLRRSVTRCCRRVSPAVSKYVASRSACRMPWTSATPSTPARAGRAALETDRVLTLDFLMSRLSHDSSSRCQTPDRGVVDGPPEDTATNRPTRLVGSPARTTPRRSPTGPRRRS